MVQQLESKVIVLYSDYCEDQQLADLYDALDQLHSAASEGQLHTVTTLSRRELIGWLRDVIYTAEETIREIDAHSARPGVVLRLVEKAPASYRQSS